MAKRKTATMQKVADAVGVSVSTVSRVFNSDDFATPETRERVLKVAAQMGYAQLRRTIPSRPMASLGGGQSSACALGNIVLLAPDAMIDGLQSGNWIYQDIVPTLQRLARKYGFNLILSSYGRDDDWNYDAINAKRIGGVLCMAHELEQQLARISASVPVVVLNDNTLWPPQTCVMSCNRMVVYKALAHLVELGHRRIAYFDVDESPAEPSVHCGERLERFREGMVHFGIDTDPNLIVRERFGVGEHPEAVARAMDRIEAMGVRPSAIVSPLTYAIQFLKETRKRGITVPDDLSIVAFDNAAAAELVDPALTTVDCLFGRCAEVAVELLIEEKRAAHKELRNILLEPQLIARNSTKRLG